MSDIEEHLVNHSSRESFSKSQMEDEGFPVFLHLGDTVVTTHIEYTDTLQVFHEAVVGNGYNDAEGSFFMNRKKLEMDQPLVSQQVKPECNIFFLGSLPGGADKDPTTKKNKKKKHKNTSSGELVSETPIPTDPEFLSKVAFLIPRNKYRAVYRTLVRENSDRDIEAIEHDHHQQGLQEKKYQVLLKWTKKTPGEIVTVEQLQEALCANGCEDIAEKCPCILKDIQHKMFDALSDEEKRRRMTRYIHEVINPEMKDEPQELDYDTLANKIYIKYSSFKRYKLGSLVSFLEKSDDFVRSRRKGKYVVSQKPHALAKKKVEVTATDDDQLHTKPVSTKGNAEMQQLHWQHANTMNTGVENTEAPSIPKENHTVNMVNETSHIKPHAMHTRPEYSQVVIGNVVTNYSKDSERVHNTQHLEQSPLIADDVEPDSSSSSDTHTDHTNKMFTVSRSPQNSLECSPGLTESLEDLQHLLPRPGDNCLKFVASPIPYIDDNSNDLFEDIISMWNTTNREKSYIVVGASPCSPSHTLGTTDHKLFGLSSVYHQSNEFYQNRFKAAADCFNYIPTFSYSQQESDGMVFGLFTIESSKGAGKPCIQKKTVGDNVSSNLPLGANWCRVQNQNEVVPNNVADITQKWFTPASMASVTLLPAAELPSDKKSMLFLEALEAFDDDCTPVLISNCPFDSTNAPLHYLGLAPWLKVFDFDIDSAASNGVLSQCEEIIRTQLEIKISTWMDTANDLTDTATEWFFPLGYKRKRVSICDDTIRQWKEKTCKGVENHCDAIAEYCLSRTQLVIFILWYGEQCYAAHLGHILRSLERLFGLENPKGIRMVLCYETAKHERERVILETLCEELDIHQIPEISLENVCRCFSSLGKMASIHRSSASEYELPTSDRINKPCFTASDAAWLKSELDVLYVNYPLTPDDDFKTEEERAEHFYRGGTMSWYMLKTSKEYKYDVKRDICVEVTERVKSLVDTGKSAVVELFHDPGSGGTTLVRRILWNTKQNGRATCVRVISLDNINEVVIRIQKIWDRTSLPIVVLADGYDQATVRRLHRLLKIGGRVQNIILHVQRRTTKHGKSNENKLRFHLHGKVTEEEASGMVVAFGQCCPNEKKAQLNQLEVDVRNGKTHHVFEFGLTAHSHKYFAITPYVKAYLGSTSNRNSWQTVLSYLALAYFYGHVWVPAQFFVSVGILQRPRGGKTLANSLPESARELMIEEKEGRVVRWRPRHYVIAKEILEQVLYRGRRPRYGSGNKEGLSDVARRCLSGFACEFLDHAARTKMRHKEKGPKEIMDIVVAVVINRDTKFDVNQDEKKADRKPLQSRLLTDIPSSAPHTDRMKVLRKVTEAFPADPNGWAQLGRYCGIWRPDEEDEAEKCFETALRLRKQEIESTTVHKNTDDPEQVLPDQVLTQICHMYGMLFSRKIRVRTRRSGMQSFPVEEMDQAGSDFHNRVSDAVEIAQTAVHYFELCREYKGHGNEDTYGYIGEIDIRLMIVEFIEFNYPGGFFPYLQCKVVDPSTTEFLNECFYTCDYLIRDCFEKVPSDDLHDFAQVVNLFHALFKGTKFAFDMWQEEDTISNRRSMIVAIKIKARREGNKSVEYSDDVQDARDLTKLVELHERNLLEVYERDVKLNLDTDMQEWLKLIRHDSFPKVYEIGEVLDMVRKWYDTRRSKLAQFYLFILHTILGTGGVQAGQVGETRNFIEALRLLPEVQKSRVFFSNPRPKREWLGVHDRERGKVGIKRLVSYKQLVTYSASRDRDRERDQLIWEIPKVYAFLEARKGTISTIKKTTAGYIDLDDNLTTRQSSLSIFFVPDKFSGTPYPGQRVEFHVAFTIEHGLEALNVSEVKKRKCKHCSKMYELSVLSIGGLKYKSCSCGYPIKIDDN